MFLPRTNLSKIRKRCPININDVENSFRFFEIVIHGDSFINLDEATSYLTNGLNKLFNKLLYLHVYTIPLRVQQGVQS